MAILKDLYTRSINKTLHIQVFNIFFQADSYIFQTTQRDNLKINQSREKLHPTINLIFSYSTKRLMSFTLKQHLQTVK